MSARARHGSSHLVQGQPQIRRELRASLDDKRASLDDMRACLKKWRSGDSNLEALQRGEGQAASALALQRQRAMSLGRSDRQVRLRPEEAEKRTAQL